MGVGAHSAQPSSPQHAPIMAGGVGNTILPGSPVAPQPQLRPQVTSGELPSRETPMVLPPPAPMVVVPTTPNQLLEPQAPAPSMEPVLSPAQPSPVPPLLPTPQKATYTASSTLDSGSSGVSDDAHEANPVTQLPDPGPVLVPAPAPAAPTTVQAPIPASVPPDSPPTPSLVPTAPVHVPRQNEIEREDYDAYGGAEVPLPPAPVGAGLPSLGSIQD